MPNSPIDWTSQPVMVDHLRTYAAYRRKAGGAEGSEDYQVITGLIAKQIGWVTFPFISKGVDAKTASILKAAGAFILDIYAELEAGQP